MQNKLDLEFTGDSFVAAKDFGAHGKIYCTREPNLERKETGLVLVHFESLPFSYRPRKLWFSCGVTSLNLSLIRLRRHLCILHKEKHVHVYARIGSLVH